MKKRSRTPQEIADERDREFFRPVADAIDKEAARLAWGAVAGMTPLRDDVYVELQSVPKSMLIHVPDKTWKFAGAEDTPVRGKVLSIGPKQLDVQPGELIQFYFGGLTTYYPDKRAGIVKANAIQAVLEV